MTSSTTSSKFAARRCGSPSLRWLVFLLITAVGLGLAAARARAVQPGDKRAGEQEKAAPDGDKLSKLLSDTLVAVNERLAATAPEKEKKRDAWEIAGLIVSWVATALIPAVVGIVGY